MIHFALRIAIAISMLTCLAAVGAETPVELEQVVVTGEVPGPGLWKVTNGERTLWILGTVRPLPKNIEWRSKDVEALIAQSQELIGGGKTSFDLDIGFVEGVKSIKAVSQARHNPDDATLVDILEPGVYGKWRELKLRYIGRSNRLERLRPIYALGELREEALDDLDLTYDSAIWPALRKFAKKHRVKITTPDVNVEVKIEHVSAVAKEMAAMTIDDRECFRSAISQLESELAGMIERANAWSYGDIAELTRLHSRPQTETCDQVIRRTMLANGTADSNSAAKEFAERAISEQAKANAEMQRRWLAAIKHAMENNRTTFAVLPIFDLVNPQGRLQSLRQLGYTIEEPATVTP